MPISELSLEIDSSRSKASAVKTWLKQPVKKLVQDVSDHSTQEAINKAGLILEVSLMKRLLILCTILAGAPTLHSLSINQVNLSNPQQILVEQEAQATEPETIQAVKLPEQAELPQQPEY